MIVNGDETTTGLQLQKLNQRAFLIMQIGGKSNCLILVFIIFKFSYVFGFL